MRINKRLTLAAIVLPVLLAACKNNSSTSSTAATSTITRTTDTFTGTVPVKGDDFHSFVVAATGPIDVTLASTSPQAAVVMGLSIGSPLNGSCMVLAGATTNTPAGASSQLSGLASPATLCVDVRDLGSDTSPVSYSVTVLHP